MTRCFQTFDWYCTWYPSFTQVFPLIWQLPACLPLCLQQDLMSVFVPPSPQADMEPEHSLSSPTLILLGICCSDKTQYSQSTHG